MSFASTLNAYCNAVNCTNSELAAESGVSHSSLSRYRRGERTPKTGSAIVRQLAFGIASLSTKGDSRAPLEASEVKRTLEAELNATRMVGMDFNMRLDMIMHLTGLSNATIAHYVDVDPSYVSRIRRGQRIPADIQQFSAIVSHLAARTCIDGGMLDELGELIELPDLADEFPTWDMGDESNIAEIIEVWLTGGQIVEADMKNMEELLAWGDSTDFSSWIFFNVENRQEDRDRPAPVARFYYGLGGMRAAELDFLTMAAEERVHELLLSSDMPLMHMDPGSIFLRKYRHSVVEVLRAGGRVNVFFNVERPLEDTIRSLRIWVPLYMTGHVSPYYLQGVNNRLFYHMNYVCDTCALSAEAVIGHEEDGRYYFTTRPEDIEYYQKKMRFVLERASSMVEIFRSCDPGRQEAFEAEEAARRATQSGRQIGAERFRNITVMSYPNNCTVITVPSGGEAVHFVIKHPKVNYIISRLK